MNYDEWKLQAPDEYEEEEDYLDYLDLADEKYEQKRDEDDTTK